MNIQISFQTSKRKIERAFLSAARLSQDRFKELVIWQIKFSNLPKMIFILLTGSHCSPFGEAEAATSTLLIGHPPGLERYREAERGKEPPRDQQQRMVQSIILDYF